MVKHAYLIMAHADFYTLLALLKCIDDKRNDIYLHIDKKSKNIPWKDLKDSVKFANVIITERLSVRWGGFTQIQCELMLLQTASKHGDYAYYHLLSGNDLPLRSQNYIHEFYRAHQGSEFIQFASQELLVSCNCYERMRFYSFFQGFSKHKNALIRNGFSIFNAVSIHLQMLFHVDRIHELDKKLAFGANWFSITQKLVDYVIYNIHWIKKHYCYTRCADEMFLQMLVYNSDFYKRVYMKTPADSLDGYSILRKIDWKRGNPYVYHIGDKEELMNSDCLYARKFNSDVDKQIIDDLCKVVIQ